MTNKLQVNIVVVFAVHERRFFFNTTFIKRKVKIMTKVNEFEYYEQVKDWSFDEFQITSEKLTNWDLYEILEKVTNEKSKILDLGTGGGEKVLSRFPKRVKEILGTDYSSAMIETAKKNLSLSDRTNVAFRIMNNLAMDVPDEYYDVVVARNTVTDPKQIYKALKPGGVLLIHGVDMFDCYGLKLVFGRGQAMNDSKPISIIDYEAVLAAGFKDVELVPIHEREYFKTKELLAAFLRKVPILDEFSEEEGDFKDFYSPEIEDDKLDEYVSQNTYPEGIRLIRRYYGITARK